MTFKRNDLVKIENYKENYNGAVGTIFSIYDTEVTIIRLVPDIKDSFSECHIIPISNIKKVDSDTLQNIKFIGQNPIRLRNAEFNIVDGKLIKEHENLYFGLFNIEPVEKSSDNSIRPIYMSMLKSDFELV